MGFIFSPPAAPSPQPAPPVPGLDDPDVQQRKRRLRLAALRRRGRRASILTGAQGALGDAPVQRKTLLGQ